MYLSDQYTQQLKALLPPGRLWDSLREQGRLCGDLLAALADEGVRIDARGNDLIDESDPLSTYELLPDLESFAGLPDDCAGELATIEQRRNALHERLAGSTGFSRPYIIGIAESLGYVGATIDEFEPFTVGSDVDARLFDVDWRFIWILNLPDDSGVVYFTADSGVDERLANWGDALLECVINRLRPAHTRVFFAYQ